MLLGHSTFSPRQQNTVVWHCIFPDIHLKVCEKRRLKFELRSAVITSGVLINWTKISYCLVHWLHITFFANLLPSVWALFLGFGVFVPPANRIFKPASWTVVILFCLVSFDRHIEVAASTSAFSFVCDWNSSLCLTWPFPIRCVINDFSHSVLCWKL